MIERKVLCPGCKAETIYSNKNPFRPFCSERCQLIDFGEWATGRYAIPAEDATKDSLDEKETKTDPENGEDNG